MRPKMAKNQIPEQRMSDLKLVAISRRAWPIRRPFQFEMDALGW